eukprot:1556609-Ditylum_brightwellii.AAC.1
MHKIEVYDWFPLYGNAKEEEPFDMFKPKGKHPIKWYYKCQNCVETSTYGFKIVSGNIDVDLAVDVKYNLQMLGAP